MVPWNAVLALGMVAAQARLCVAVQEAAQTVSWIGALDPLDEGRLQDEQHNWMQ